MRSLLASLLMLALWAACPPMAFTAPIDLADLAWNIDHTLTFLGDPVPAAVQASGFDTATGLGLLSVTVRGAGPHVVVLVVDHELDQILNGFSNEFGLIQGTPATGQSWEIDRPGFPFGDIFDNVQIGQLDSTNSIPATMPDDVSLALAWHFTLQDGEVARVTFGLSTDVASSGFVLLQRDVDTQTMLAFSSALRIEQETTTIPEPGTWLLLGSGLLALVARQTVTRNRGKVQRH